MIINPFIKDYGLMKKSIIITLSLCVSFLIVAGETDLGKPEKTKSLTFRQTSSSNPANLSADNQFNNLHDLCNKTYTLLQKELLEALNNIDLHIHRWKQERLHPVKSTLTQSPRFWISSMAYTDMITRNVFRLKLKHQKTAENLGKLNEIIQDFKQVDTLDSIKHHILRHQTTLTEVIGYHKPAENLPDESYSRLANYLIKSLTVVKDYKKHLNFELQEFKSPNHFERNWIKYLASITALAASGYYVYHNQDALHEYASNWTTTAKEGVQNFWETHIKEAFTNARDAIFKPQVNAETRKEDIESGCRQLKNILKSYFAELSETDIDGAVEQYRTTLTIPNDIIKEINKMEESPATNLANPLNWNRYKNVLLFWSHTKKIQVEDVQQQIDILLKIALVSPALFIAKTSMSGASKVINIFKKQHVYEPVKKYLLKMERKLNAQTNKSEKPSYGDQGLMIYWGNQLRKVLYLIPANNRFEFMKDIKEIERPNFNAQQKISTIKRMYRTYDFLNPSIH
jgi:Asp-tRNA(Asn)/Glu-tRNA(Gln) amidotransferase C subunit